MGCLQMKQQVLCAFIGNRNNLLRLTEMSFAAFIVYGNLKSY